LNELVEQARNGDGRAFAEIMRRCQNMALAYAVGRLGDFQMAEDAVQESFITAFYGLDSLDDPRAFPGWLRTIVKHQCHRILRSRPPAPVPLDAIAEPSTIVDLAEAVVARFDADGAMAAVMALPSDQRDIVLLYYLQEHSQGEIAQFLGLSVTTVNNRLHAARTTLRRRMTTMVKSTLGDRKLGDAFTDRIGRIVKIRGPIVDVQWETEDLPLALGSLQPCPEATSPRRLQALEGDTWATLQVAQRLGGGRFRCVAVAPRNSRLDTYSGLKPGVAFVRTASDSAREVPAEDLKSVVDGFVRTKANGSRIIETGIKAIDLFCPIVAGGTVGLFGIAGIGKAVVLGELIRRLGADHDGFTLFNLAKRTERTLSEEAIRTDQEMFGLVDKVGHIETVHLISDLAADAEYAASLRVLDSAIYCNIELANQGIWPAIDSLVSNSKALTPATVGKAHCEVIARIRKTISRSRELMLDPAYLRYLAHGAAGPAARRAAEYRPARLAELSPVDRLLAVRARKLELFMSQPFHVAEPYTKRPGAVVTRADAVDACQEILDGRYDDVDEEAFRFIGGIEELAK
jgi:RNA polymerase sigma factor (sigma-70 family)